MARIATALAALLAMTCLLAPQARGQTYRLDYDAAVLGVVVLGTAHYEVSANGSRYGVQANLRTTGLARLFDQTDISATSTGVIATGGAVGWARYDLSHSYAGKFRRIQLNRSTSGISSVIAPRYSNMGTPPATVAQQNGSFDPLSAVFALGRQIGAARACRGSTLVFDGRQHYRLSVSPRSAGTFSGGGFNGPALSCNFRYEPIAGFEADANRSAIPVAEAWFALPQQPGFAPPLRLIVPTPLGNAQLDLRHYELTDVNS